MPLLNVLRIALVCHVAQSLRSCSIASAKCRNETVKDPNVYYTTTELACSEGYAVQEHTVVTDDGYVLTIYRMPNGRNRPKVPRKRHQYRKVHSRHHPDFEKCVRESSSQTSKGFPLLFVHGLVISSDWWLLQGPDYDLAYIMADRGYDVWLANIRGNFYSRKHLKLNPSDPKFWDFSFHEHGIYDMPATIDYILKVTKREKLGYIGYSMGTTMFFAMSSMRPEYNEKVAGFAALAPVAYIKEEYMDRKRREIFQLIIQLVEEFKRKGDVYELFPRSTTIADFAKIYCSRGSRLQDFCYDSIVLLFGYHSKLTLRTKLHLYLSHLPSGTSLKNLDHYTQNVKGNGFKLYDYGREKNVKVYGSPVPPDYPLGNVTAPVGLYYTKGDLYYDIKDIQDLRKLLPNVVDVDEKLKFNHGDYLWSFKSRDVLYPKVTAFFNKLTKQHLQSKKKKKAVKT